MLHIFDSARLLLIILLSVFCGCTPKSNKIIPAYTSYKFDNKVIEKLPAYDSLAAAILKEIQLFQVNVIEGDDYYAFRYMPTSDDPDVHKKLPDQIETNFSQYLSNIGNDFIYGFDVFKDSSIKIYIRKRTINSTKVEIEENLSYYPAGNSKKQRAYPVKDTVLNKHWQYWTRFDTPDFF